MKGIFPYHLQGKGKGKGKGKWVLAEVWGPPPNLKSKNGSFGSTEPTSVLDTRSPSPPTSSASTLSSSLGDTAAMVPVPDNQSHKWLPAQHTTSSAAGLASERANDVQPMPAWSEIGAGGGEKCCLGMEEWENVLSESASSPGNEQSLVQWFASDMDDPSLKQLLQGGGGAPEFESTGAGLGIRDMGFGFEHVSTPENANANANAFDTPAAAAANFPCLNPNKLLSIQNPTNSLPNFNVSSSFDSSNNNDDGNPPPNPIFANNLSLLPPSLSPSMLDPPLDQKPRVFNLPHQNPAFLLPPPYVHASPAQQEHHHLLLPPQPKRHQPTIPDMGLHMPFLRPHQQSFSNLHLAPHHLQHKPLKVMCAGDGSATLQQQTLVDQLLKAAELIGAGNSIHAQGILARLNHQLSPVGKPLHRAAFYFKEALQQLLLLDSSSTPRSHSPLDAVFKISAYKAFSEVSPFLQFVNFTSNQVLLEALHGCDTIHIVDFGIDLGGQWASFMQDLALRPGGVPSLKITAFASPSSQDPLELCLAKENLSHFANNLAIPFEFNLFNIDSLDFSSIAALPIFYRSENEVVAVNLPIGSYTPSLLRLVVKQLSPKIVITVDCGCDRMELPFSHHFLNALQSYSLLLDSLDAVNVNFDAVQKIERLVLQPKIASTVLGWHRTGEKMPPWRSLFTSTGFSPVPFSNFTETQADYLLNRLQLRGFHVEKLQASLCLCWQQGELVSVSAWRC